MIQYHQNAQAGQTIVEPAAYMAQARAGERRGVDSTEVGLRVMSFNLRVSTIFDFQNTWGLRKGLVANVIRQFDPDVLGAQECLASQAADLRAAMPDYGFVGVGRNDGKASGEMCPIFYRRDRFKLLDHGFFWLSDSPDQAGSRSWFEIFPRVVTWVELRTKGRGAEVFYVFNLHPDNFFAYARVRSMVLLRKRVQAIAGDSPVLITGDFNAVEGSRPYRLLVDGPGVNGRKLTDTFRASNPRWTQGDGTRSGFGGHTGGPRIDWILTTPRFAVQAAGIDHGHSGWRYPSDHFPIVAILSLKRPRPGALEPVVAGTVHHGDDTVAANVAVKKKRD